MDSTHRLSVIATALLFSVSLARGQEAPDPSVLVGKIANWPASAYWSPPEQTVSVQEREGGLRMEGVEALPTSPLPFIGITPCRIADTRQAGFPAGYGLPALTAGVPRNFTLTGKCGIPAGAQAVSLNVTVTNTQGAGFILIFPQGSAQPDVSTLNYVAGQTIANAAVVPLGAGGGITVIAGVSGTDLILDTNGYYAGAGVGLFNTFLGLNAGNFTMTGSLNAGFGEDALSSNTTGVGNTATGYGALGQNTTGSNNIAVGALALFDNTTGGGNTATGVFALNGNTTGSFSTAIGLGALQNTTGHSNIGIGRDGGSNLTTGNFNICIGNSGVAGELSTIRIGTGGTHHRAFLAGVRGVATGVNDAVNVVIDSAGQLGTAMFSSRRIKEAIAEMGDRTDRLLQLRPVTFRYKPELDPSGTLQYGLIAEEVAEVFPELVVFDREGQPETVRYHVLPSLLLNEAQKQHRTAEAQEKTIEQLKARLSKLEARLLADSRPLRSRSRN